MSDEEEIEHLNNYNTYREIPEDKLFSNEYNSNNDEVDNYFMALKTWLTSVTENQTNLFNAATQQIILQQQIQSDFQTANTGAIPRIQGYECQIASIWKRIAAEFIDGFILFLIKFYLIVILHDGFDITFNQYINYLDNPKKIFNFTTEIIVVEVISRLLIFIYESYFLYVDGATPGKKIMGLQVCVVDTIYPIPGRMTVCASPCEPIGWSRAVFRSIFKNIGFLIFPLCYGFMVNNYSRAGYDQILNTFVIDTSQRPLIPGNYYNE